MGGLKVTFLLLVIKILRCTCSHVTFEIMYLCFSVGNLESWECAQGGLDKMRASAKECN